MGSAETLRETRGRRPIRADEPPPAVPEAAREEGRGLSLDEAVDDALAGNDEFRRLGRSIQMTESDPESRGERR